MQCHLFVAPMHQKENVRQFYDSRGLLTALTVSTIKHINKLSDGRIISSLKLIYFLGN